MRPKIVQNPESSVSSNMIEEKINYAFSSTGFSTQEFPPFPSAQMFRSKASLRKGKRVMSEIPSQQTDEMVS